MINLLLLYLMQESPENWAFLKDRRGGRQNTTQHTTPYHHITPPHHHTTPYYTTSHHTTTALHSTHTTTPHHITHPAHYTTIQHSPHHTPSTPHTYAAGRRVLCRSIGHWRKCTGYSPSSSEHLHGSLPLHPRSPWPHSLRPKENHVVTSVFDGAVCGVYSRCL